MYDRSILKYFFLLILNGCFELYSNKQANSHWVKYLHLVYNSINRLHNPTGITEANPSYKIQSIYNFSCIKHMYNMRKYVLLYYNYMFIFKKKK